MLYAKIESRVREALQRAVADGNYPNVIERVKLDRPDQPQFGDWSINAAMVAAKDAGCPPRELAAALQPYLAAIDVVERVEIAGPGFLNLFLRPTFEASVFGDFAAWAKTGGPVEGRTDPESILLELVSANPTGPLHIGHGRGAAVGDSVARLLRRAGHRVTTEYYVNDAGKQMRNLGLSLLARVRQARGEDAELPPNGYRGDYLIEIADRFLAEHGEAFAGWDEATAADRCQRYAETAILDGIRTDLETFRVTIDNWRSERELYDSGAVADAMAKLDAGGWLEERDGARWFRCDQLGDDKPRVVVRDNGEPTYFAADIAYHREKFARGFDRAVDFWGADHHGYEPRIRASLKALGQPDETLEIRFIQFVSLVQGGEAVAMSTRAGTFETLADVYGEVGLDAARFFYLLRRPESHLEFDLDLARTQANENPVYYVQYAHTRVASLRRIAAEQDLAPASEITPEDLSDEADRDLLKVLLRYPDVLAAAAADRAPHQVVFYLQDLAAAFHGYYNKQRILDAEPAPVAAARLALADLVGWVIADALDIIGVEAPERM